MSLNDLEPVISSLNLESVCMTLTLWLQNQKALFFLLHGRHILGVNELGQVLWFKICPLGLSLNFLGWSWPLCLWPQNQNAVRFADKEDITKFLVELDPIFLL